MSLMIDEKVLKDSKKRFNDSLTVSSSDSDLKNLIFLYLNNEGKAQDTIDIFELLPIESFIKIIKYFNGRRVRFIDSSFLEEILRTAIIYNEVENQKISWDKVISRYPEWKIDKNRDQVRINKMKRILQKNMNLILFGENDEKRNNRKDEESSKSFF